jgi:hypothetical protein
LFCFAVGSRPVLVRVAGVAPGCVVPAAVVDETSVVVVVVLLDRAAVVPDAVGICSTYWEMAGGVASAGAVTATHTRRAIPTARSARETFRNTLPTL